MVHIADAGRFSCDAWAGSHNCALSDLAAAKAVSAAILSHDVPVSSEYPLPQVLPAGLIRAKTGGIGIFVGIRKTEPYGLTLRLIPRILRLGIGCRRGAPAEDIGLAVRAALDGARIDIRAVAELATIDIKRDETGLFEFAKSLGVAVTLYTAGELAGARGGFHGSDFVLRTVGVDNVCERAAALGGRLVVPKTAVNGVTVAAAVSDWRPEF